jgi:hypothetical protein
VQAEPAGPIMAALHETLNPWLGQPTTKQNAGRVTFKYKFNSEGTPPIPLKLKVEINTREHFAVFGYQSVPFAVASPWFEGKCDIPSYHIDELLGTKMRALHQRKKGRDLLDLHIGLQAKGVSGERIVEALHKYMEHGNTPITRAVFEKTFAGKLASPQFTADIGPLLAPEHAAMDGSSTYRDQALALAREQSYDAFGRGEVPHYECAPSRIALSPPTP